MDQQNTPLSRQQMPSDEIDLFELWGLLAKRKRFIAVIVMASVLISSVVAMVMPPVYQVSAYFLPPPIEEAEKLNVDDLSEGRGKESSGYTAEDLYLSFQRNFRSRASLWDFFLEQKLYESYLEEGYSSEDVRDVFNRKFVKSIRLNLPNPQKEDVAFVNATFEWGDARKAAELLNKYVQEVQDRTSQQLLDSKKSVISSKLSRLEEKISALRNTAIELQKMELYRLAEAESIARKLGIKRGEQTSVDNSVFVSSSESETATFDKKPAYYRGYEVLEVEQEAIRKRKNIDPFVPGLEADLIAVDYLKSIQFSDRIIAAIVTQSAEVVNVPIKPKKKLIIILGSAFGGVFAVLLAFFISAIERQRTFYSSSR